MSDSVRPQRRQPTRLPHPWDSPGKNTGVGCHFLLQCMKVKSESEVAQSHPTLVTPWTAAYQTPPSMGLSRQEYWNGVPLPSLNTSLVHILKITLSNFLFKLYILYKLYTLIYSYLFYQKMLVLFPNKTTNFSPYFCSKKNKSNIIFQTVTL